MLGNHVPLYHNQCPSRVAINWSKKILFGFEEEEYLVSPSYTFFQQVSTFFIIINTTIVSIIIFELFAFYDTFNSI